jgi:hypothetical protein
MRYNHGLQSGPILKKNYMPDLQALLADYYPFYH